MIGRSGLRIGRLFGINIRIDWSWLLIFFLITWNLATVFGEFHADWDPPLRWGVAIIAAILFFVSVLLHELAHSLVAKARGLPVRNITLHLFGGASNIERDPDSPKTEFVMAILGPITSLVIGAILLLGGSLGADSLDTSVSNSNEMIGQLSPLFTLVLWLGSINVILGIFNLTPGFPLDGGRILRSILWAIVDDLRRATRWASWAGQGIAWLMVVSGISMIFGARIPFFGTGFSNGLWLAFIGWFLHNAAVQSYHQVVIQDVLEGVSVERMMRTQPPVVSPKVSIDSLVHEHVMGSDDYAFPVLDNGQLVGLVTLDDVRSVSREAWTEITVAQIMTPAAELSTVSPQQEASKALIELTRRDVRQLPVLCEGELLGLLRRRDIIRWLKLQSEEL